MRSLSTTAVLAVTGLLALLLIAYVLIAPGRHVSDRAPHCPSREALAQVKGELFRRAGELRGSTDPAFAELQNTSVVRAQSRMLRRHYARSNKVGCTGNIVLDLPPGVGSADGNRSLTAAVKYDLKPQSSGPARLSNLSQADPIVVPLANLSLSNGRADQAAASGQPMPTEGTAPPPEIVLQPPETRRPPAPAARQSPPPAPPAPRVNTRQVTPKPAPKQAAPKPLAPKPRAPAPAPAVRRAPPSVAQARPSFDCGAARSRSEIAVCSNPALANLDRRMSALFQSAWAVARPGQREMLRRSGRRFLRYRDSCGSTACIEDAYRGRIREIRDITTGGW